MVRRSLFFNVALPIVYDNLKLTVAMWSVLSSLAGND